MQNTYFSLDKALLPQTTTGSLAHGSPFNQAEISAIFSFTRRAGSSGNVVVVGVVGVVVGVVVVVVVGVVVGCVAVFGGAVVVASVVVAGDVVVVVVVV